MGNLRAFVALYPDREAHRAIVAFRDDLRSSAPKEGIRWAKDDQLHLTLRFMGELPKERLEELVSRLTASCCEVGALRLCASFEGEPWKSARVIALRITAVGPSLQKLQRRVESDVQAIGLPAETKEFHAHFTLARIDHPRLQPRAPRRDVAEWTVGELVLVRSELGARGAVHSELARFPLQ